MRRGAGLSKGGQPLFRYHKASLLFGFEIGRGSQSCAYLGWPGLVLTCFRASASRSARNCWRICWTRRLDTPCAAAISLVLWRGIFELAAITSASRSAASRSRWRARHDGSSMFTPTSRAAIAAQKRLSSRCGTASGRPRSSICRTLNAQAQPLPFQGTRIRSAHRISISIP